MSTSQQRQRQAAEMGLHGSPLRRISWASKAMVTLLRDPEDTEQVFLLSLMLNRRVMPAFLRRFAAHPGGARLLAETPSIDSSQIDYAALAELPATTLGGAYARFLEHNQLDADFFQAPPGLPDDIAYLVKRMRQSHDLWHVVTGYTTSVADEIALQAFVYAQTRMPSPLMIAAFGTARFLLADRAARLGAWRGYRRGREAHWLVPVRWEELWESPLHDVRTKLGISAC
ncbi:MAG: ubiquinone biosynthesis protein COQ4 [Myxococcota bacterium]|jgi:ubiquinone biosynthesis protein COQ4